MSLLLMRFFAVGLVSTTICLGCDDGNGDGGSATSGASGASAASGSDGVAGGSGNNAGGSSSGTAGTGAGSTGGSASGGVLNDGAGAGGEPASAGAGGSPFVNCDQSKVMCRRPLPECPAGEAPSIEGSCYGPCVPITECRCQIAAECPNQEEYTCWMQQHCGPFVR